jgi:hypothetical protein
MLLKHMKEMETILTEELSLFDMTNSIQQSPSWEASSHLSDQEIPHPLWNPRFITMFTRAHCWFQGTHPSLRPYVTFCNMIVLLWWGIAVTVYWLSTTAYFIYSQLPSPCGCWLISFLVQNWRNFSWFLLGTWSWSVTVILTHPHGGK